MHWRVNGKLLKSVVDNYNVLISTWEESLEEKLESDIRARIGGVKSQMETFDFYLGQKVACLILKVTDNFSATLQTSSMTASDRGPSGSCWSNPHVGNHA